MSCGDATGTSVGSDGGWAPAELPASLPGGLEHLTRVAAGRAWLERVPALLARARERWHLELTTPFTSGSAAWTCRARREGDTRWDLVLKVSFPHDEAAHEAEALLHWQGHGAPRLLDYDVADWALLMEALTPGTPLSASSLPTERALAAGAELIATLHDAPVSAPGSFPRLEDTLASWDDLIVRRAALHTWAPTDGELRELWPGVVADLLSAPHRRVLLHGDANPGNLLASQEPSDGGGLRWTAIDPKALIGDPAFDPWPLIEQIGPDPFAASDPVAELRARAAPIAPILGTTTRAIAGWGFVRRLESALWLTDLVARDERPVEPEQRGDLERQWRETRHWHEAYVRTK